MIVLNLIKNGPLRRAQPGESAFRMPGRHRISAEQAMLFIGSIRERLSVIALAGEEYADALQASSARGIVGGGIYDAMLAHCAIKAQAEIIYTWNARHYSLCAPDVTQRVSALICGNGIGAHHSDGQSARPPAGVLAQWPHATEVYSKIGASFARMSSMTASGTRSSSLPPRARRSSARG